MNELDGLIGGWRRTMTGAGMKSPAELNELESHLREDIHSLVTAGMREGEAFDLASSRLGSPASVGKEFQKIRGTSTNLVRIGTAVWILGTIAPGVLLFHRLMDGQIGILLFGHVMMIVAGYLAAFVVGTFGAVQIGSMAWGRTSAKGDLGLSKAIFRFAKIGTVTVALGFVLGSLWSRENLGSYFRADPREIGGIVVWLCLAALWKLQISGHSQRRRVTFLSVGTSLATSLAWFGAPLIEANPKSHLYGFPYFWPLILCVMLHVGIMLVPVLRNGEGKEKAGY
ncbi:MAG: ccsA [Verrucomicrobiales bacterium]|nr:ccsA [Verrucomicrobiales bacterium]